MITKDMAELTEVSIIPATPEHGPAVYELLCELEGEDLDREGFFWAYEANLWDENILCFLAMWEDRPVGFASLHVQRLLHHLAAVGEIQEIIVAREFRGRGVGRALFQKAREAAVERSCVQLEVCCRRTRTQSHAFYEKMGMENTHFKFCLPLLGN
jgi:PhnO protein